MESSSTGSFGNGHIDGDSLQGASSNGGQVSLPYGSADFLNDDKVSAPGFAGVKKSSEQEKAGNETAKVSGGHRQPGICAVCNRDAANTVLSSLITAVCTLVVGVILFLARHREFLRFSSFHSSQLISFASQQYCHKEVTVQLD